MKKFITGFTQLHNCDEASSIYEQKSQNQAFMGSQREGNQNKEFTKNCNRSCVTGFTLVETMVVIAITLVISTMLLTYNRSSEKQIALFRDQAVLAGFFNRAKSLAIEKFNKNPRVCAYGVYFPAAEPDTFILFQDLQPEESEKVFGCRNHGVYNSNLKFDDGEEMERYKIDSRLKFEEIPVDLSIVFIPPEITVTSTVSLPVILKIQTVDNSNFATITVGEVGQIMAE